MFIEYELFTIYTLIRDHLPDFIIEEKIEQNLDLFNSPEGVEVLNELPNNKKIKNKFSLLLKLFFTASRIKQTANYENKKQSTNYTLIDILDKNENTIPSNEKKTKQSNNEEDPNNWELHTLLLLKEKQQLTKDKEELEKKVKSLEEEIRNIKNRNKTLESKNQRLNRVIKKICKLFNIKIPKSLEVLPLYISKILTKLKKQQN